MGWSDAARAAAAETRKRNKKGATRTRRKIVTANNYGYDDDGRRGVGILGRTRTMRALKIKY